MKGLFWGLLTIDLQFYIDDFPEENSKVKAKKFSAFIGGPVTNAAITFRHLGGQSKLITAIGRNSFKPMIMEELSEYEVEVFDLKSGEQDDPVFASVITSQTSGSRTIFSCHPKEATTPPLQMITREIKIALFDGFYMKSSIDAARKCRELGITTVLDGGSWKPGSNELLQYIDIAICSADFYPPGVQTFDDVTEYLLKKGVQKTAITRGEKPIITNEGEVNYLVKVPRTKTVDTLGAGDIFHGAFCYFYGTSGNFLLSLEKASQIASYSCQFEGPRGWMEQD